jgi:KUP system potassium uptake protein
VSVIGAMISTSILSVIAVRRVMKKPAWLAALVVSPFLVVEAVFLASNLLKVPDGGYVPLLIAAVLMVAMWTWVSGTKILIQRTRKDITVQDVFKGLEVNPPHTVKGTAVFLTAEPHAAPAALLHNLKHNKVLHERNVILNVQTAQVPYVPDDKKIEVVKLLPNLERMTMTFGYMETPNVTQGLAVAKKKCGFAFDIMSTSFFLSRRTLLPDGKWGMPLWQDHLFIFLSRNSTNASEFFRIPTSRVVEMGSQMVI